MSNVLTLTHPTLEYPHAYLHLNLVPFKPVTASKEDRSIYGVTATALSS